MAFKIQLRRDLAVKWTENNPVLLLGEFGYEYDTKSAKIGDGQTPWQDLDYFVGGTGASSEDFISLSDTPSGYTGASDYYVRVNSNGTGLEFISHETLTSLIDVRGATGFEPGDAGKYLRVNIGGTGFEWATVTGGTGGGAYFNSTPTLTGVGGIAEGSTFENTVLDRMWNALLHPEEEPGFDYLSVNSSGSTGAYINLEVGEAMDSSLDFYWTVNNEAEFKPNTVEIYDVTDSVSIATGLGVTGSPEFHTYGSSIKYTDKDSHTWRYTAVGQSDITFTKELTVNWYYPIFSGRSSDPTLTNAQIITLGDRVAKEDSSGDYVYSASDDYIYVCLPNGGADYQIKGMTVNGIPFDLAGSDDGFGAVDSAGLTYDSVPSVNINGESKTYRVYRSKYKIAEGLTLTLSNTELSTGLKVTGVIKPLSETEEYPILDPKYGIDGLRNVDLVSEMYSIPQGRRKLGMLVGVGITGSNGVYYKLVNEPGTANTTTADWLVFNAGDVTYSDGGTGPTVSGATGLTIEGGDRIEVTLTEGPTGVANYSVDIPRLISGGTA